MNRARAAMRLHVVLLFGLLGCCAAEAPSASHRPTAVAVVRASALAFGDVVPRSTAARESTPPILVSDHPAAASLPPGRIAYVADSEGRSRIYTVRPDGTDKKLLSESPARLFVAASAARGGSLLVIRSEGAHEDALESLHLIGGTAKEALGVQSRFVRHPSFSIDGRHVLFESSAGGFRDIYRLRLDAGGPPQRLTHEPTGCFEPSFDPDGRSLVFVSSRGGDPEIFRLTIASEHWQRLTWSGGRDSAPRVSPDGLHIAFVSTRSGAPRAYVMGRNGSRPRPLAGADSDRTLSHDELRWSPDGKRLSFIARRRDGAALQIVRFSTGERADLQPRGGFDQTASWSPDGQYLVFASDRGGDTDLYTMRHDGTEWRRITRGPATDWLPHWYAEGPKG
ncbi:MAG: hypothetical protein VB934_04850 [Polyangiaceae bacterium]